MGISIYSFHVLPDVSLLRSKMKSVRELNLQKPVALLHNITKLCCQEISALLPCEKLSEVVAAIFRIKGFRKWRVFYLLPR